MNQNWNQHCMKRGHLLKFIFAKCSKLQSPESKVCVKSKHLCISMYVHYKQLSIFISAFLSF